MPICTIEEAISDIQEGKMLILVDDKDRENEGDLVVAAEFASAETINFMATHGRGESYAIFGNPSCEKSFLPQKWTRQTKR